MAGLTASVGVGGRNAVHDVALVRFILMKIKGAKGGPYLPSGDYTDARVGDISGAIRVFQQDNGLLQAKPGQAKAGAPRPELPGLLEPAGTSWKKLQAALPAECKNARTMGGVTLVYFPMSNSAKATARSELERSELRPEFKLKVTGLFDRFYERTGVAISANPDGLRRTFAQQMGKRSESSPGETIHNYGYAVDLGFTGMSYVSSAGRIETVDRTDSGFNRWPRIKEQIFAARNAIARSEMNMFPTVALGGGDWYHLQNYEDKPLDSVSSFMKLLEKVGPKKMKWRPEFMTWTDYWCDLGLGGEQYYVGAAVDIWADKQPLKLTKDDLAKALSAKLKADPRFSIDHYLSRPPKPKKDAPKDAPTRISADEITDEDVNKVKALLKAEFDAADKAWTKWEPVNYTGPTRPKNPKNPKNQKK